eukprot:4849665-Pleurochrysis_carterae.AAC.4
MRDETLLGRFLCHATVRDSELHIAASFCMGCRFAKSRSLVLCRTHSCACGYAHGWNGALKVSQASAEKRVRAFEPRTASLTHAPNRQRVTISDSIRG